MPGGPSVRFVTRKFPPAMGGMETYCAELASRLDSRTRLELIALPGKADGSAPSPVSLVRFGIATALRLLRAPRTDVVHLGDVASWPLGWIAALRRPGTQVVLSAHGSDVSYASRGHWKGKLYGAYLRAGARLLKGARIVANSRYVADTARSFGFREITVVPLGTNHRAAAKPNSQNGALLFAGRIMRGKGLRFLVEEVLPLLPDPPRVRVAGTVWDADEATALDHPLVDYLGPLGREDLAREYGAALAVAVPTRIPEGFGLVAVEAAACGGVVIASDHSGLRDAVLPGHGFLVGDAPADWATAIEIVRAMPTAERRAFASAAMAAAHARFDWDLVTDETIKLYRNAEAPVPSV